MGGPGYFALLSGTGVAMLGFIKNKAIQIALNHLRDKNMNPTLEGIAKIKEIAWKDGKLHLNLTLDGLENHAIEIDCARLEIAPDGSSITVGEFSSNMPFAANALNNFAARTYDIPTDGPRAALKAAKLALGV